MHIFVVHVADTTRVLYALGGLKRTLSPNSVTFGHARVTLVTKITRLYYNNDNNNFIYSYPTLIT